MRIFGSTDQMEVILDTEKVNISISQRWKCDFLTMGRHEGRWTEGEKITFRNKAVDLINEMWGNKAYAQTTLGCNSRFAQAHNGKRFIINPLIDFVEDNQHWTLKIYKARPKHYFVDETTAWVDWNSKEIHITSGAVNQFQYHDLADRSDAGAQYHVVAHEFGHTLGNIAQFNTGDEYRTHHPLKHDKASIMNHGSEVRERHFRYIRHILMNMCPDTDFTVRLR